MLRVILCVLISILFYAYSLLRYRHLWKRGKVPVAVYYVLQVLSAGITVVVSFFPAVLAVDFLFLAGRCYVTLYLAVMLLTPPLCFLRGCVRFLGKRLHRQGRIYRFFNHPTKMILLFLALTLAAGLYGYLNEHNIRSVSYEIAVEKQTDDAQESEQNSEQNAEKGKELSIVYLSDLRVGSDMTEGELAKLVSRINEKSPDLILFGGGLVDANVSQTVLDQTIEQLGELSATEGIYLVTSGAEADVLEAAEEKLEKEGLYLLLDQYVSLRGGLQLIGCRDTSDEKRKELSYTTSLVTTKKPSILLSYHRLTDDILQEKAIDLALSGEEMGYHGIEKKGTTNLLSTTGLRDRVLPGRYGVPGEIVTITLKY